MPPATPPATPPPAESLCVRVDGISASWSYEREKLVLSNISLEVNKVNLCDGLTAITGMHNGLLKYTVSV